MATTQALLAVARIIISFLVGFGFFYYTSPLTKQVKRDQVQEIASLLINFVIFIWLAKILLHIQLFVTDPLAVLAYPSNAQAFYLATLFLLINLLYRKVRHGFSVLPLYQGFIPVFLAASFTFEFMQLWLKQAYSWHYLGLLMVLLIGFILLQTRVAPGKLAYSIMFAWSLGALVLMYVLPYVHVFNYTMDAWYLLSIAGVQLVLCIQTSKVRSS